MDFWLQDHFAEAVENEELPIIPQNSIIIPDLVHVESEHPTYDFQVGDLVALVSGDEDPFWLAKVKKVKQDTLSVTYYHHGPLISGKRLIWNAHNSKGTCGLLDVYCRFKREEQLFTKGKTIKKQALKKISQAC